jgi:hypothetical protein
MTPRRRVLTGVRVVSDFRNLYGQFVMGTLGVALLLL